MNFPNRRSVKDIAIATSVTAVVVSVIGGLVPWAIYESVHHDNQGNTRCHRIHGKTDDNGIHCYIGVTRVKDTRP